MTSTLSRPNTATELVLSANSPLLIVLSPYKYMWWRERHGLLYLRHDGLIDWYSDHQHKAEKIASHEAFKTMLTERWDVFITYPALADRQWYEPDLKEWRYEGEQIAIGVGSCNFKPKIFNR